VTSFTRLGSAPFWTLAPASSACTVGYIPFDPSAPPAATVTLADSWRSFPGTYLVAPPNTLLDAGLADRLTSFRAGRALRLVWVSNPQQPGPLWQASVVESDSATVSGLNALTLGSVALWIGGGCSIGPDPSGDYLVVTQRQGDADSIYLTAASGHAALSVTGAVTLPFSVAQAGCALGTLTLRDGTAPGDLARLDVGMRIFAADPNQPLPPNRLASWRYPVFAATQPSGAAAMPVGLSLHPVLPMDPDNTCLRLVPAGGRSGPQLDSCYVTTNGMRVRLTPLAPADAPAREAKFVLAVRALSDGPSPVDPYYFAPSGAFQIAVVDSGGKPLSGPQKLMCGVSGIEYLLIQPNSELWFSPGGPALAVGKGLQPRVTTAYASVFGPDGAAGVVYRAQADAAALFQPAQVDGFMAFRELSGVTLPGAPSDGSLPVGYPMLAFTGILDSHLAPYQQLEFQAVSSTRRTLIGGLAPPPKFRAALSDPTTHPSITPQGLLADVDSSSNVINLTLALSPAGPVVARQITPALAAALQASQLFLVASDPSTLAAQPPTDGGPLRIPGAASDPKQTWTINGWPATWSTTGTLLVLKFAGKPLSVLAADTDSWAGDKGVAFNPGSGGVAAAQSILQELIAEARDRAGKEPEFAAFITVADDPGWQGVLFLNAPVPPAALPSQIAGLAAGIDASAFKAHHMGLTVTPATVSGGQIAQTPSALFGLIFYESPDTAAGAQPPYAFNVLNLKVRFENSMVRSFASKIELLVDELFGEPATLVDPIKLEPSVENVLLLDGVYQQQGSTGGYTFTTPNDNLFSMDSAVLDTVDVSTAQFVTVVPPVPGSPHTPAESRFVLSGTLRFKPGALDVFSFGPTSMLPPANRLSVTRMFYSNLAIGLIYKPKDRTQDVYTFDASGLVPDPSQSQPRVGSLFAGFPLTLASFVHVPKQATTAGAPTRATPASLGFLGIGTTPPLGGTISEPWFGIVADLGFGTAGALAAEAGFKASMLLSWSPGTDLSANAGIGLKLPGTGSGGKLLSLQGVLKLQIGELKLSRNGGIYLLELDRIALSVLMLTIPSAGQFNALLFADPTGKDHTSLGWYAGYAKKGGS
jgi:hypothetical protein